MAMMECPRCGFTQPKDRYCANCGLDTDNYTPRKDSVGQSLLKNPMLYVMGGIVLIAAVAIFLTKVNSNVSVETPAVVENPNVAPTSENLDASSSTPNVPAQNPSAAAPVVSNPAPQQAASQQTAPPATQNEIADTTVTTRPLAARGAFDAGEDVASSEGEGVEAEGPAETAAPAAPTGTTVPATPVQPTQIQMQFYEFPRAALAQAAGQSQVISEGDQYRILLHPNADELLNWLKSGRRLPGSRAGAVKEGSNIFANFELSATPAGGVAPPPTPTNAGLNVDAMVSQVTANGATVEVRGFYNSATPVRFGTSQALTTNSTLLIFGVVPHSGGIETTNPPSNSPLVILDSVDFADNLSEFVIVLSVR